MINFERRAGNFGVTAILHNEIFLEELERGSMQYAIDRIGSTIVERMGEEVIKGINLGKLLEMVKEKAASSLSQKLEISIKKS